MDSTRGEGQGRRYATVMAMAMAMANCTRVRGVSEAIEAIEAARGVPSLIEGMKMIYRIRIND